VAEGHDVGFLLYYGERPNFTFRVGTAYPKVRSKKGFTGGEAPNGGARSDIEKSGGVAEGHDVGFLLYSGERLQGVRRNIEKSGNRPNPTFRVGTAYPKVRSKRGFTGGFAPNGGARRNIGLVMRVKIVYT